MTSDVEKSERHTPKLQLKYDPKDVLKIANTFPATRFSTSWRTRDRGGSWSRWRRSSVFTA